LRDFEIIFWHKCLSHNNILLRQGTVSLLQRSRSHLYFEGIMLTQLEITDTIIQRTIFSNWILSFSFLFIIPACLRNIFGGIRHLRDSSCYFYFSNLRNQHLKFPAYLNSRNMKSMHLIIKCLKIIFKEQLIERYKIKVYPIPKMIVHTRLTS
jgi:hypothetical protein